MLQVSFQIARIFECHEKIKTILGTNQQNKLNYCMFYTIRIMENLKNLLEEANIVSHEAVESELDRAVQSVESQSVKVRQIVEKILTILLKLDCRPFEQSKCPNEKICHYKIHDAIYHMVSIIEKYDRIKTDICSAGVGNLSYDGFEEYIVSSTRRVDYLKTIARRLSAVGENIAKVYNEIVQDECTKSDLDSSTLSGGDE